MNLKQTAIYTVVIVAVSVATTRYYFPNIQEKIKIQEVEVIKKDIRTVIKEVVKPDGTKETVTEIIDKTKEQSSKSLESFKIAKKDWFVGAGVSTNPSDLTPVYNLQVNRRIIGPVYLGATVNTRKDIGVVVGLEF